MDFSIVTFSRIGHGTGTDYSDFPVAQYIAWEIGLVVQPIFYCFTTCLHVLSWSSRVGFIHETTHFSRADDSDRDANFAKSFPEKMASYYTV